MKVTELKTIRTEYQKIKDHRPETESATDIIGLCHFIFYGDRRPMHLSLTTSFSDFKNVASASF